MSTPPDTSPAGTRQDRARGEDHSLRSFFLPLLVVSVIVIVVMAVVEQTVVG